MGDNSMTVEVIDIADKANEVGALLQTVFTLAAAETLSPDEGLLAVVSVAQQKVGEISDALTTFLKEAESIAA
jgi:hypothetical protein